MLLSEAFEGKGGLKGGFIFLSYFTQCIKSKSGLSILWFNNLHKLKKIKFIIILLFIELLKKATST